ncbi:MAG: hypothetical protein ACKV1O_18005, partial [Saprospiraceae bacterium]
RSFSKLPNLSSACLVSPSARSRSMVLSMDFGAFVMVVEISDPALQIAIGKIGKNKESDP